MGGPLITAVTHGTLGLCQDSAKMKRTAEKQLGYGSIAFVYYYITRRNTC